MGSSEIGTHSPTCDRRHSPWEFCPPDPTPKSFCPMHAGAVPGAACNCEPDPTPKAQPEMRGFVEIGPSSPHGAYDALKAYQAPKAQEQEAEATKILWDIQAGDSDGAPILALIRARESERERAIEAERLLGNIADLARVVSAALLKQRDEAEAEAASLRQQLASNVRYPEIALKMRAERAEQQLAEAQKETASAIAHGSKSFVEAVQLAHKLEQRLKDANELLREAQCRVGPGLSHRIEAFLSPVEPRPGNECARQRAYDSGAAPGTMGWVDCHCPLCEPRGWQGAAHRDDRSGEHVRINQREPKP